MVALPKNLPTRDPDKARPQDVREYSARDGGWTSAPAERPAPGTPNGTKGRLR